MPPAPWDIQRWIARGEQYFHDQWFDDAARLFREALAWSPGDIRAANDLACTLWEQRRHGEAVSLLEGVLARHPEAAEARANLEQMQAALAGAEQTPVPAAGTVDAAPAGERPAP